MSRKIENRIGLIGTVSHYENGKRIGERRPGLFGGSTLYDNRGKRIGESSPSLFGGSSFYDNRGHKAGESRVGIFSSSLYDNRGHKTGETTPQLPGEYYTTERKKVMCDNPSPQWTGVYCKS